MKTTRRGIFKLIAGAAACTVLPVPKWDKPESTSEFSKEEWTALLEEAYKRPEALNMLGTGSWEDRPLFWREKILEMYPASKPSDLMTILGKLRKP
jgi:hypothetical protein